MPAFACAFALASAFACTSALLGATTAHAQDDGDPTRLSDRYRLVSRLVVPVEEISGWSPLRGEVGSPSRAFLAVSDEGTWHASDRTVRGALYRMSFRVADGGHVALEASQAVTLHLGDLIPRLDPAWTKGHSLLDLEACVPLPGTHDIFLLAGERNPEDATDGGANRLYVVRYPGRAHAGDASPDRADLLAYLRLPDLRDDTINDRFEAVVAVSVPPTDPGAPGADAPGAAPAGPGALHAGAAHTWRVFAFKERTQAPDRPPVYFPLLLRRDADGTFSLASPYLDRYLPSLPAVLPDPRRLGSQADACLDPAGRVWVLDRWRREVHVAALARPDALELDFVESLDLHDVVREVPGEEGTTEHAAPGGRHAGYGRHEALTFDASGWIWLAADLGGGRESVVTVLAPRAGQAPDRAPASPPGDDDAWPDDGSGQPDDGR